MGREGVVYFIGFEFMVYDSRVVKQEGGAKRNMVKVFPVLCAG